MHADVRVYAGNYGLDYSGIIQLFIMEVIQLEIHMILLGVGNLLS